MNRIGHKDSQGSGYMLKWLDDLGTNIRLRATENPKTRQAVDSAPCEGLSVSFSLFFREKAKTWYSWDFVKWRAKFMFIFRWQAHDSKVKIGISQKRKTNFVIEGPKKKTCFQVVRSAAASASSFSASAPQNGSQVPQVKPFSHLRYCGSTCRSMPIWNAWAFTASFILCKL